MTQNLWKENSYGSSCISVTYHLDSNQTEKLHIHSLLRMDLKPVFFYLCNNQIRCPYKYNPPIFEMTNNSEKELNCFVALFTVNWLYTFKRVYWIYLPRSPCNSFSIGTASILMSVAWASKEISSISWSWFIWTASMFFCITATSCKIWSSCSCDIIGTALKFSSLATTSF